MTTAVHHSSDYDGLFCREIARKFLPDVQLIGWDFGQPKIPFPKEGDVYILDLSPDCMEVMENDQLERVVWIDHHKSAIDKWEGFGMRGFRIDGVAASRLAYQYLKPTLVYGLPAKQDFLERKVKEPFSLTLAGEYDVWQHDNSKGEDITFQFGLDAMPGISWAALLDEGGPADEYCKEILFRGSSAQACYKKRDADIILARGFDLDFEGLKFIALNTARCNSQSFDAGVRPEHDGCFAFYWNGKAFSVSLYGVPHKPDLDLSVIAIKHGGGGHRQACGFMANELPFLC